MFKKNHISKENYLEKVKERLEEIYDNSNTIKTYLGAFKKFLDKEDEKTFYKVETTTQKFLDHIQTLKTKNEIIKAKIVAKIFFDNYYQQLNNPLLKIYKTKEHPKKKIFEPVNVNILIKKINNINNYYLKIAFRLMLLTGLTAEEISKLTTDDISFEKKTNRKNSTLDYFIEVKEKTHSTKPRIICGIEDNYILDNLKEIVDYVEPEVRIFFCSSYLQRIAKKHNFSCYQLRCIFSHILYYNVKYNVNRETLVNELGLEKNSLQYLNYLKYPINLENTRWAERVQFTKRNFYKQY